jgi:DNA-binding beta-propeller fold protein YncE
MVNTVSVYRIDQTSGALTQVTGSPFPTGQVPVAVMANPTGKFAYVTNLIDETVSGYSIDHKTGALTPLSTSPFLTGPEPAGLAVDPNGKFAYVANVNSNEVSGVSLDPLTGALAPLPGSPFGAGTDPQSVAIDPAAQFAYVTNSSDNTVSACIIHCDGYLSPVAGSPFSTGGFPPRHSHYQIISSAGGLWLSRAQSGQDTAKGRMGAPAKGRSREDEKLGAAKICLTRTFNPATRVQFAAGAILQRSATPTPLFEHSLPDVASRSFRRRGEVGSTNAERRTRRACQGGL